MVLFEEPVHFLSDSSTASSKVLPSRIRAASSTALYVEVARRRCVGARSRRWC